MNEDYQAQRRIAGRFGLEGEVGSAQLPIHMADEGTREDLVNYQNEQEVYKAIVRDGIATGILDSAAQEIADSKTGNKKTRLATKVYETRIGHCMVALRVASFHPEPLSETVKEDLLEIYRELPRVKREYIAEKARQVNRARSYKTKA